ncbi:MAG: hypothetical protein U0521_19645 [Anaerolineae bacterium]
MRRRFVFPLASVAGVEYSQARAGNRHQPGKGSTFLVIEPGTEVPLHLKHIQYADLTNGLDVNTVKTLLSAIFKAERELQQAAIEHAAAVGAAVNANGGVLTTPVITPVTTPTTPPTTIPSPLTGGAVPSKSDGKTMFDDAVRAFRSCDYDKAVFLLKQVQESAYMLASSTSTRCCGRRNRRWSGRHTSARRSANTCPSPC